MEWKVGVFPSFFFERMISWIHRPFYFSRQVIQRETSTQPATAQMHSTATWFPRQWKTRRRKVKSLALTSFWKGRFTPTLRYSPPNWSVEGALVAPLFSWHPHVFLFFLPRWKTIQTRSVGSWRRFGALPTPRTDSPPSSSSWTTSSTPTVGSCAMRRCLAPAMSAPAGPAPPR